MHTPLFKQRPRRQVHMLHLECFGTRYQALANVISTAKETQTNPVPRMLVKQNTSL